MYSAPIFDRFTEATGIEVRAVFDTEANKTVGLVNRLLAEALLNKFGCTVTCVNDGIEAIEAWENGRWDLLLMDCQMPRLDGYEATRAIRSAEQPGERIPIIAVTASAMVGDKERCLEAGMDDFLAKPIRIDSLESKLAQWIAC